MRFEVTVVVAALRGRQAAHHRQVPRRPAPRRPLNGQPVGSSTSTGAEFPRAGWIGAIVRHEALHGATARRRELSLDAVGGDAGSSAERTERAAAVWESKVSYARELTRLLLEVIDELPPTFREVVRLRDLEDRPPEEVARRLHISSRNVAVRLHRAHKLLRPRLLRRIAGAEAIRSSKKNL